MNTFLQAIMDRQCEAGPEYHFPIVRRFSREEYDTILDISGALWAEKKRLRRSPELIAMDWLREGNL